MKVLRQRFHTTFAFPLKSTPVTFRCYETPSTGDWIPCQRNLGHISLDEHTFAPLSSVVSEQFDYPNDVIVTFMAPQLSHVLKSTTSLDVTPYFPVDLQRLEEHSASIFRSKSKPSKHFGKLLPDYKTPYEERGSHSSETLVNLYQTIRCHVPEDCTLHSHHRENTHQWFIPHFSPYLRPLHATTEIISHLMCRVQRRQRSLVAHGSERCMITLTPCWNICQNILTN
jgi:hypothetical protein